MGTAYIETTVTAEEGGVFLFETDCVAEIEYELDNNDLYDWSIVDFRFDKTEGRWDGEVFRQVKLAEVWCPDDFRSILLRHVDHAEVQERLIDRLTDAGELTLPGNSLRSDYHASVL